MPERIERTVLEKANRPGPDLIGVLRYGEGKKYAVIYEQNSLPQCFFVTSQDFIEQGVPLPDIKSDRVLDLDPRITEINIFLTAPVPGETVTERRGIVSGRSPSLNLKAVSIGGDTETSSETYVGMTDVEMLRVMYGPTQDSNSGIISFDGPNRDGEVAVCIERVKSPDGAAQVRSADILFVSPYTGSTSMHGVREFLHEMIQAFRTSEGSDSELNNMWEVVDVIDSSPTTSQLQEKLVNAHLIAEALLSRRGKIEVYIPQWRALYKRLTSFKNRLDLFFNGQEHAKAARLEDVGEFIHELIGDILIRDYYLMQTDQSSSGIIAGKASEQSESDDFVSKLQTDAGKKIYLSMVEGLETAEELLQRQGSGQIEKGKTAVLSQTFSTLTNIVEDLMGRSKGNLSDVDLMFLEDAVECYSLLFTEYTAWWSQKGSVWFPGNYCLDNPAYYFFERNYRTRRDDFYSSEREAVQISALALGNAITEYLVNRITDEKIRSLRKAV